MGDRPFLSACPRGSASSSPTSVFISVFAFIDPCLLNWGRVTSSSCWVGMEQRVISVISAVQRGEQGQCPEEEAVGAGVDAALFCWAPWSLAEPAAGAGAAASFVPSPFHGTARRELRALGGMEGMSPVPSPQPDTAHGLALALSPALSARRGRVPVAGSRLHVEHLAVAQGSLSS